MASVKYKPGDKVRVTVDVGMAKAGDVLTLKRPWDELDGWLFEEVDYWLEEDMFELVPSTTCPGLMPASDIYRQSYPDNNPKTVLGLKKPAMSPVPPAALLHLSRAMSDGRRKYGLMNWREKRVSSSIYYDAAMRHLMAWFDGEEEAEDSGVHHLGHVMGCMAIILDAYETGNLNDDRPVKGKFAELVKRYTEAA